ncbi:MAG: PD-(D/E)XK motif protein [Alphaproteobacteria bacterium]|nr:PD-(D/E)XK motif protein [Alphaproteobacteria bacterium]
MIEALWQSIRRGGREAQQRVDQFHPLDLYADFRLPDRPGLMLITGQRPPDHFMPRAISLESGLRNDGRWSVRMSLEVPGLLPVFAELCRDIIEALRKDVPDRRAASAFIDRIERWRLLLEKGASGLSVEQSRGLIAELTVLQTVVLPCWSREQAVAAWTGPLAMPQDFLLPDGTHMEVKAVGRNADSVRINGLQQLDAGNDVLQLLTVEMEKTGADAAGAVTVGLLVDAIRQELTEAPRAATEFENLLSFTGWSGGGENYAVQLGSIGVYPVDVAFPRLTGSIVPRGVLDASYTIRLPRPSETRDPDTWISQNSTQT